MSSKFKRYVPSLVVFAVLVLNAAPASAETPSPWFHLASVSRPENLQPAKVASDEVQKLTVTATKGDVLLLEPVALSKGELKTAVFPYNAKHEEVQSKLEGLYGAGNVEVPTGEGNPTGSDPYEIIFTGALSVQRVEPISEELVTDACLLNPSFECLEGEAKVAQLTEGAFEGSKIAVTAINLGDASADGETTPVTITDRLPAGVTALSAAGNSVNNGIEERGPVGCVVESPGEVRCTFAEGCRVTDVECPVEQALLPPFEQLEVVIEVQVAPDADSGERTEVSVSGGGAPAARLEHPITVGRPAEAPAFGVESYEQTFEEVGGAPDAQAGSHPFQFTTTLDFNEAAGHADLKEGNSGEPAALAKDLSFKLPAGVVGNPTAYPRCTLAQFSNVPNLANQCPADTALGVAVVTISLFGHVDTYSTPLYNLEPQQGEPARFGFMTDKVPTFLDTSVRTGEDYGVTVHVANIPQTIGFMSNSVTFWGVPGDARHDNSRGSGCLEAADGRTQNVLPCTHLEQVDPAPFVALPTSCTGPLQDSAEADSWAQPASRLSVQSEPRQAPLEGSMQALDGCGLVSFGSQIEVSADVEAGSTPSGLKVDVHVPQEGALNASGLAPADVRNITVALPEGVQLNPSAADGLQACSEAQVALHGDSESSCPNASKIATATITTPLLPHPLTGFVYLASPQNFAGSLENPFGSLVAMYLVARDPVSGTLVKLAGRVGLSETGQISATFENNPQLPFEDAEIEFFGGERAPLATPAHCGAYTTGATFEPWTNGGEVDEVLHSNSTFDISSGPNGASCPGSSLPFAPALSSESTDINAGGFTPLSTTISREDGQQQIENVTIHYPPGVSGVLAGVPLCPEAEANAGTCPESSQIGETIVSVGVGGDPFTVTGGKVYLTEGYAGAPFGLSIVNPAKAGPFDLQEGRPVVVRAKIEINPLTAALTVATTSIPQVVDGFPLQIKHVNVLVNRPGFTFNPTSCAPTQITASVGAWEGATSPVSDPFQVTNCAALRFEPKLAVSTAGKASKEDGASLRFDIAYPPVPGRGKGAMGSEANFSEAKFDLPRQLPARLTTIQKACLAATFESNPAACPAASLIGHAVVHTQVLPVPLQGPVYFVSYGGAKFPEAVLVLQGDGVTVDLHGETFIAAKTGITSATFRNTPDVPFESIEVTVPAGPFSEFGANLPAGAKGSFCGQNLKMPTLFKAQNGLEVHADTAIAVTGCAPTPAQKLAAALKACKHKPKGKRAACETQAHKRYSPTNKKTKKKK
jgi:hypothetical protein